MSARGDSSASNELLRGFALIALTCVVAVVVFWLLISYIADEIFPGASGIVHSTSMDPYDVYLRVDYGLASREFVNPPGEWHLRVPSAFVTSEYGTNGALNDTARPLRRGPPNIYIINLGLYLDPITGVFEAASVQKRADRKLKFDVKLRNTLVSNVPKYYADICRRNDEDQSNVAWCEKDGSFCDLNMSYHGWSVGFSSVSAFLGNKDKQAKACDHLRSFLDTYTVAIDDMRWK